MPIKTNIVDLRSARAVKEFINTASDQILRLEDALYNIMSARDIQIAKEIAADALDEDLEIYNEEDIYDELDFEDDDNIAWDDITSEE